MERNVIIEATSGMRRCGAHHLRLGGLNAGKGDLDSLLK